MRKYHLNEALLAGLILLVTILPLVYSSKVTEVALYPKLLVMNVLILILAVFWFMKVLKVKELRFHASPLLLPIAFYLINNTLSLQQSINLEASYYALSFLIMLIILFFLILNNVSLKSIPVILRFAVFSGSVTAIIGISQYLGWGFYGIPSAGLPSSTYAYRNMAAMVMIMTIPFGVWCFFSIRGWIKEFLWGFMTATMLLFLLYTRTRGAWVGLTLSIVFVSAIVILLRSARPTLFTKLKAVYFDRRKLIFVGFFAIIILFMSQLPPSDRVEADLGGRKASGIYATSLTIFQEGGSSGRFTLWGRTLNMISDGWNWLTGVGLNNYQYAYPPYSKGFLANTNIIATRPHNDYLWIWSETGIVGLGVYFWLLITVFWMVWRILTTHPHPRLTFLTIILLSSIIAILGHALFSFPKERITPSMLFWMNLGFLSIIYNKVTTELDVAKDKYYHRLSRGSASLLIGVTIVIALFATDISRRWVMFDYYFLRAHQHLHYDQYAPTIAELQKAKQYGLLNYQANFLMGIAYTRMEAYQSAIAAYLDCLQENPNYLNAHYNLGTIYHRVGEYLKAAEHLLTCIAIDPNFHDGHVNLAASLQNLGMIDEAIQEYRKAIRLDPESPVAYNNLGILYGNQDEIETAIKMFTKALEIDPEYENAKENLRTALKHHVLRAPDTSGED